MKKTILKIVFLIALTFTFTFTYAQMTSPEEPGGGPSEGDPPIGGGAPIKSAVGVLLVLGAAYGGYKVYKLKKKEQKA